MPKPIMFFLIMGLCLWILALVPSAYAANANLFVSAENAQFQNYFAGPMVIEVVVVDSSISDTSEPVGEPDVTVNGKELRMVQAVDGNWYAYFADRVMAQRADATVTMEGKSLDFGKFCKNSSGNLGTSFADTAGVAVPRYVSLGTDGLTVFQNCIAPPSNTALLNHVVREPKTINTNINSTGQIGLHQFAWPIIQLYDFVPSGNVVIQYNKGGSVQSTVLTFDAVDQFANIQLDKTTYPTGSDVEVTLTDPQLNIDSTDEDSWSWSTGFGMQSVYYQLFDENGNTDADGTAGAANLVMNLGNLMFENNGDVHLTPIVGNAPFAVNLVDNNDQRLVGGMVITQARTEGNSLPANTQPMTFTELNRSSGIFANYDESDNANLVIASDAQGGSSAVIVYAGIQRTISVEAPELPPPSVSLSNLRIADEFGNALSEVVVGKQVQIVADIKNNNNFNQPFVFYVQVLGMPQPSWISGQLAPQQNFSPATSHTFSAPGTYTIHAYIYSDIDTKTVLAGPLTMNVTVSRGMEPPQTISVFTQKTNYHSGEQIFVSGSVNPVNTGIPVTIEVIPSLSAQPINIEQVDVSPDGQYSIKIMPDAPWDENQGNFVIRATYNGAVAETNVNYSNMFPVAIITAPDSVDVESEIRFSASNSYDPDGTIQKYYWDFGDGNSEAGQSVTHKYKENDDFLVKLTVVDNNGALGTNELLLRVILPQSEPVAEIKGPTSAHVGSEFILSAYGSYDPDGGSIIKYRWELEDGRVLEDPEIKLAYPSSGQYDIRLIVTDDEDYLDERTITITIDERPTPPPPKNPWPDWIIPLAGGGGAAAAGIISLTHISKPIPKPHVPANVTLSLRLSRPRVGTR